MAENNGRGHAGAFARSAGLAPADLSRILGCSRNLGAMILRGERKLTLKHVRTLSRRFRVSADLFCNPRPRSDSPGGDFQQLRVTSRILIPSLAPLFYCGFPPRSF